MLDVLPVNLGGAVVVHVHQLMGEDGGDCAQVLALIRADDHLVDLPVVPKHLYWYDITPPGYPL